MQDGKRIEVSRGRAWEGEGRREGGLGSEKIEYIY
jgi:hypothetical protein